LTGYLRFYDVIERLDPRHRHLAEGLIAVSPHAVTVRMQLALDRLFTHIGSKAHPEKPHDLERMMHKKAAIISENSP
jgi:hypothetical protein